MTASGKSFVLDKSYSPKITKESVRVHCKEVSTAEDSGHRNFLEDEVVDFVTQFLGGQYLKTIFKKPTLRSFAGKPSTCKDGLLKLLDGKKVVEAVKRCATIYEDQAKREEET